MTDDPLASIAFVEIPAQLAAAHPDLFPSGGISIPVETATQPERLDTEALTNEMIITGMLRVLAHVPDHEHAPSYRRIVTALQPGIVESLLETGVSHARAEQFEAAEELFRALIGLAPERLEGPVNLAIVLQQRADAVAEEEPETAQALRSEAYTAYRGVLAGGGAVPPRIVFNAGMFFLQIENPDAARDALTRFLEETDESDEVGELREQATAALDELESQQSLDALFQEAYDFVRIGEEAHGIEKIQEFLTRFPDAWNGWFLLGWGRRRLAQFGEAAAAFERAIELGGDTTDTWNELAICRLELGDTGGAQEALRRALTHEPENSKIMSNMGVVSLREGRRSEAIAFFRSALEYDEADPVARQYLTELADE